jgi:uncharacterized protein YndB with AHSA1/START domain
MKWLLVVAGALVALAVLIVVVGALRPRTHVASRAFRLEKPPADVWAVVSDLARLPEWFSEVTRVERIEDIDGRPAYRETYGGNFTVTTVVREWEDQRKLVREILPGGMFYGSWTLELAPDGEGMTRLTITERGTIDNPFFRGMMVFHDNYKTMTQYAEALARRLGARMEVEKG